MGNDNSEYAGYLQLGLRVEIGIPLAGGGSFRDWAIVKEFHRDLILAQMSRDYLPANVRISIGFILDVSVTKEKEAYTCSGIVTEKMGDRNLWIRLFGSFVLKERRQFFRLDTALSLKYSFPAVSIRQEVEREWHKRRELASLRYQGYDEMVIAARMAEFEPSQELTWHEMADAPGNIGGGGMRVKFAQKFRGGELVNLELHLPLNPPRVVHTVGEVIYILEPPWGVENSGKPLYTGMQFAYMHEWDRDLIFQFVSMIQVERLRRIQDQRPVKVRTDVHAEPSDRSASWQIVVKRVVLTLLVFITAYYCVRYFVRYKTTGSSNEIKQIFDHSIKGYHKDK